MRRKRGIAISALLLGNLLVLGGCADLPRDPGGTLERVRTQKVIRVGHIAGTPESAAARAALARVAAVNGARIEQIPGHGEALLESLEAGELDLVYGHFADDSPWASAVHFGTPPGGPEHPAKSQRVARFAFRMGENGWITALEEASR